MKFEPPSSDIQPPVKDEASQFHLEHHYTDDQLLIELRRRGRIARVEASNVTPGRFVDDYPPHMQFEKLMMLCAGGMVQLLGTHVAIPGAKVTRCHDLCVYGEPAGRRMTMALNVIVEKGHA